MMTLKEQVPSFPLKSRQVCVTGVVVSAEKKVGGVAEAAFTKAVPERSLHVGGVHLTSTPVVPNSTVSKMVAGLSTHIGGVVSSVDKTDS